MPDSPFRLLTSGPPFNADVDAIVDMFVDVLRDAGGLEGPAFECDLRRRTRNDTGEGIEIDEGKEKSSEEGLRNGDRAMLE